MEENKFEHLADLLISFKFYFVVDGNNLCIFTICYLVLECTPSVHKYKTLFFKKKKFDQSIDNRSYSSRKNSKE
jgi:hypothetical protein